MTTKKAIEKFLKAEVILDNKIDKYTDYIDNGKQWKIAIIGV